MRKTKLVILCLLVVTLIAGTAGVFFYKAPNQVFQRIYPFELPVSSHIIQSDYSILHNSASMKIELNKDEFTIVESKFRQYFGGNPGISDYSTLPHHENSCSWWDLDEDEIVFAYIDSSSGKLVKTKTSYAIATKNDNDLYYLYVIFY